MDVETLDAMSKLITNLRNVNKVNLLPYHTTGRVKYTKWNMVYKMGDGALPPTKDEIEQAIKILEDNGIKNLQIDG